MTNETVCEKLLKSAFRRVLTALRKFLNIIENGRGKAVKSARCRDSVPAYREFY